MFMQAFIKRTVHKNLLKELKISNSPLKSSGHFSFSMENVECLCLNTSSFLPLYWIDTLYFYRSISVSPASENTFLQFKKTWPYTLLGNSELVEGGGPLFRILHALHRPIYLSGHDVMPC